MNGDDTMNVETMTVIQCYVQKQNLKMKMLYEGDKVKM